MQHNQTINRVLLWLQALSQSLPSQPYGILRRWALTG